MENNPPSYGTRPRKHRALVKQGGFPGDAMIKSLAANAGDTRDSGLIPGLGRSPGGGHGNPLQHSCLETPMDRGAWWARSMGHKELDMTEAT